MRCMLAAAGPGGGGDSAVPEAQHHDGERAVPGAGVGGERGRLAHGPGHQPRQLQRDGALARRPADADGVVGRARVRDAVPHPPWPDLHLPLHRRRAGGHPLVARPQLMAPGHRPRRPHHPPPRRRRCCLPLQRRRQAARQGDPHPAWYIRTCY